MVFPHARITPCYNEIKEKKSVYPACAGIHLTLLLYSCFCLSLPRMRGDPPVKQQ